MVRSVGIDYAQGHGKAFFGFAAAGELSEYAEGEFAGLWSAGRRCGFLVF